MRTSRMLAAAAALAVGLAACDNGPVGPELDPSDELGAILAGGGGGSDGTERPDTETRERRDTDTGPRGGSIFARLNEQIEGFAGLYRVAPCGVVVVLTAAADVDEAVRIVHAVIEPLVVRSCPTGVRVMPERGTYTYGELHRYLRIALPLVDARGVYAARVNYALNAVLITVANREIAHRVLGALTGQGVPADALAFRVRGTGRTSR